MIVVIPQMSLLGNGRKFTQPKIIIPLSSINFLKSYYIYLSLAFLSHVYTYAYLESNAKWRTPLMQSNLKFPIVGYFVHHGCCSSGALRAGFWKVVLLTPNHLILFKNCEAIKFLFQALRHKKLSNLNCTELKQTNHRWQFILLILSQNKAAITTNSKFRLHKQTYEKDLLEVSNQLTANLQ